MSALLRNGDAASARPVFPMCLYSHGTFRHSHFSFSLPPMFQNDERIADVPSAQAANGGRHPGRGRPGRDPWRFTYNHGAAIRRLARRSVVRTHDPAVVPPLEGHAFQAGRSVGCVASFPAPAGGVASWAGSRLVFVVRLLGTASDIGSGGVAAAAAEPVGTAIVGDGARQMIPQTLAVDESPGERRQWRLGRFPESIFRGGFCRWNIPKASPLPGMH